ncbi:hypothetical protein IW249_005404 [Micromonospora vinacea]|uniref:Uncharacterized protein n=1 Tax=Micromonospora vinacea TaxID=709878 RepID=A0ABS0K8N3_9ACTN|nr:hypothetical protein [Micromonospora vinacea]
MLRRRTDQLDLGHRQPDPGKAPLLPQPHQASRRAAGGGVLGDQEVVGHDGGVAVQQVFHPGGDAGVRLTAGHRLKLDRGVQAG